MKIYRKIADLPRTVALFPLAGAILFPRAALPLNIFEPRYLNMIDDALRGDRIIAMIQPAGEALDPQAPRLSEVGTIGRITSFAETEDGRYLITLSGVCRFRVGRELKVDTPYRQAIVAYDDFAEDFKLPEASIDRDKLRFTLQRYVDLHGFQADWSAVDGAPPEALVNTVATVCPFDSPAKQALLEAPSLGDRCAALIVLLEWGAGAPTSDRRSLQ